MNLYGDMTKIVNANLKSGFLLEIEQRWSRPERDKRCCVRFTGGRRTSFRPRAYFQKPVSSMYSFDTSLSDKMCNLLASSRNTSTIDKDCQAMLSNWAGYYCTVQMY